MGKAKMKLGTAGCLGLLVLLGAVGMCGQCSADQMAAPAATVMPRGTNPAVRATSSPSMTPATPLIKASSTPPMLSTSVTRV